MLLVSPHPVGMDPRMSMLLLMNANRSPRPRRHLMLRWMCDWEYFVSSRALAACMTLAVYEARGSLIPRAMDSNAIHLMRAWAVVNSIVDAEAIHWRMDKPLATEDGCVESPVNMVSCSAVSAFVRRVKRVVLAEWPDSGHTGMRDDLSGVRRTEKKSDPARRPMTRMSQFLPSLGS